MVGVAARSCVALLVGATVTACGVSPQATTTSAAAHRVPATPMDDGAVSMGAVDADGPLDAGATGDDGATASDSASYVSPALDSGPSNDASVPDPQSLATSNAAFAFDLYHALTGGDPTPNLAFAPYSLSVALTMAYAGAAGETAAQMASALHFDLPAPRLHAAFEATDLALASRGGDAGALTLNVADSLWVDQSIPLLQPFLDTLSGAYGSPAQAVDFVNSPDPARLAINQWVSGATSGNVSDLFPAGSITQQTRVVLANAIYLDAPWLAYFNSADTHAGPFTRLDGSVVQATTMGTGATPLSYAATSAYQAVELPYAGNQTSMVLVLPAAAQFGALEPILSGAFFEQLTGSLAPAHVVVALPKFTLQGAPTSLRTALTSLGMTDAFAAGADFSAMSSANLNLEDVLQQTTVSIDELRTKAAAATGTSVGWYGSASYTDTVYVTIDRPFFFFIRDIPTNTLLFVGRVTDPTQ